MQNLSLRAYLQRIGSWIEENKIDEAISHSSHLLQQFPLNLNIFQVLSKALLQKQDFDKADQVFDIILQIEPDDFVSHIGKSIIAEFNHKLDLAIEHMKLAFESQPANESLQNELKRLLLASDGFEPNKIPLTRGALIKMYFKGKLYQQAISEAKIGISENSQRIDYKIALAKSFYETGDLVLAVETCIEIISQLPYCLPANQILDQVLSNNYTIQNNAFYHNRLIEIDPYYAFMLASTKSVLDVPDIAVMVETDPEVELINLDLESILSSIAINKAEISGAESSPISLSDWDSIISSGTESLANKSPKENKIAQDNKESTNLTQSEVLANPRKKNFLDKLRISKSPSEAPKDIPDWFFDENGDIYRKEFDSNYPEFEDASEVASLDSEADGLGSDSSEDGLFDTDINPAISAQDDVNSSNTLWINDEDDSIDETFPKSEDALEDTQQITIVTENPGDLLIDSAKALEGGNTKFAFDTLNKLIDDNKNLPEVVNQLERAIELYPESTEFRLLLGNAYSVLGEKEKALAIFRNAQNNISL